MKYPRAVSLGVLPLLLTACAPAPLVDVVKPVERSLRDTFRETAKTRLLRTFPVTVPVSGSIRRVDLEPGDVVTKGQALVQYDRVPFEHAVKEAEAAVRELTGQLAVKDNEKLEETARIDAQQTVKASEDALRSADAQVEARAVRSARASKEAARMELLGAEGTITATQLDDARVAAETALIELRGQELTRAALRALVVAINLGPRMIDDWIGRKRQERVVVAHQQAQATVRLERARYELSLAQVRSPVDGVVLERYEQGPGPLTAGQPLLLLGRMQDMEAEAEVLTQEATRIGPGTKVLLTGGRGELEVVGEVRRIAPAAFTKRSSLGVEQQRVKVQITLASRPDALGVGYRLRAVFVVEEKATALVVPRFSVLEAPDGSYYVLLVKDGSLERRAVRLGIRGERELEILDGLTTSDVLVATPEATLEAGQAVRVRSEGFAPRSS